MIPPGFLHDLLGRVDIVEVVGRHVELRKTGANRQGLCPFHGEKTPSFIVSPSRQTYHCFGCGVHGNAIDFLMEHVGAGFVDAVHELAGQCGLAVPDDGASAADRARAAELKQARTTLSGVLQRAAGHYRAQLKGSPRAVDYLKRRGLTGAIAARFALGYASDGWRGLASAFPAYDDPLLEESGLVIVREGEGGDAAQRSRYDRFRDRIMFPIRSVQGEVIGFGGRVLEGGEPKYLNSPETPVFSKGRELYGLYEARTAIRERGYAIVVEGYMDVVALAQSGFGNAVATLGTACTSEHLHKLFRFTDAVVFSFDGDTAGRRAAGRALEAAAPLATDVRSVRFLFLPAEHDPDSFVRAQGAEAFERCVDDAVPLSRQLLEHAREGGDASTAEGRARWLANARPIWQALPDGALRRQLFGELAKAGGLSTVDLSQLWRDSNRIDASAGAVGDGADAPRRRAGWSARPAAAAARRPAPATPADHALRMLLLHSDWWDRLSADDHELLHELPPPHGELFAWLERYLAEHGASPWAALAQALADAGLRDAVEPRLPVSVFDDEMSYDALSRVLDDLHIEHLGRESERVAASGTDPATFDRLRHLARELEARRTRVRAFLSKAVP